MKTVWFIRHAESEANAGLSTLDPQTISLSKKGFQQAITLADEIHIIPELIVYSTHLRTLQTAKPFLEKFPLVPHHAIPIYEFDFLSPLECMNTNQDQRKPWVNNYWQRNDPDFVHGKGAESFNQFTHRILSCMRVLENKLEKRIVVFAHGHVIRLIWQYFGNHLEGNDQAMTYFRNQMTLLPVPNTGVFKSHYTGEHWIIEEPNFKFLDLS